MPNISKLFVLLAIVTAGAILIMSPLTTFGLASTSFPAEYTGYFYGGSATTGNFVLTDSVMDGSTDSIPVAVNSKATLISFIKNIYYHGSFQNRMGAAFIIQTMRSNGTVYNRNYPSDAEVDDWVSRVNNYPGTINWNESKAQAGINSNSMNTFYSGSDVSWYRGAGSASPDGVIVFTSPNGHVDYMIKRNCGNPIGSLSGLATNSWSLSASSTPYVNGTVVSSAKPGDTIQWVNKLNNNGPDATSQTIYSNVALSGFTNGWPSPVAGANTGSGQGPGTIRTIIDYATYGVTQNDVGHTLCEMVQYDPANSDGARNGRGNNACVVIAYGYTLTPQVSTDVSGVVEPGSTVNVTPTVNNSGPTKSQNTQWQVTQIVVAPGQAVPNATGGTSPAAVAPCGTYFRALPNATCSTIKSGTSVFDTNGNVLSGDQLGVSPVVVGDLAIGTKICFAFSVQPSSNSSDVWTHSAPTCLIIGRKPKIQILGGDLLSAGGVNTSTTNKDIGGTNYTFGSWIEYGIFAVKTITGAGSGSAYAGGGLANANNCNTSQLSFTNSGTSTCSPGTTIGNYANSTSIPDVAASFPTTGAPVFGGGDLTTQASGVYTGSGTINISGGNIAAGKWFVLNAPGATVNISGNITYFNGTMNNISDIPQVVIIAGNINIAGSATQVDSWLVTSGALNTCSDVAISASLSSDVCNQPLVVNGPVMAGQLYMRRTAGSGAGAAHSGDPAEVFNLRPDAYLWASLRATDPNRIQTVYSTELPPRL